MPLPLGSLTPLAESVGGERERERQSLFLFLL